VSHVTLQTFQSIQCILIHDSLQIGFPAPGSQSQPPRAARGRGISHLLGQRQPGFEQSLRACCRLAFRVDA